MLNKRTRVSIGIVFIGITLILIGYIFRDTFRIDRFGSSEMSWIDCFQINNSKYYSDFNRTSIDYSLIDKKIGQVKFNVYENVHNGNYKFRNGDATFLEVGTEIYSLKLQSNSLAVKINKTYFLYKGDKVE